MKIAPFTERWNDGERDWSFVQCARGDIEAWESRERISLPNDYREFMLRYNGGYVYPRFFRTAAALTGMLGPFAPESSVARLDLIYSWQAVEAHWRGETYGGGVPGGHIVFADTPGGIELLMALTKENHGHIYAWVPTSCAWGEEGNRQIFPLADTFSQFLQQLFDDACGSDYEDWCLPIYKQLAKELEL